MTLVYRILSLFITLVALLFVVFLVVILPMFIMVPVMWLPTFIIASIVLYTWFSAKFRIKVLLRNQVVRQSLYDWVRVNGFVAIIFCLLQIPAAISLISNPGIAAEMMKQFSAQYGKEFQKGFQSSDITTVACIMLAYLISLLIHVLWTFTLMKKRKENFQ